ncbi:MAG: hypothetical protein SOT07_04840 [Paludibacteraceae bacterium]|nr:hypothetical protein [Paludibacteraceae bacterium]
MKQNLLVILLAILPIFAMAQESVLEQIITDVFALDGSPEVEARNNSYFVKLADSCYLETYHYGDSILLVQTVCAPLCSSVARMYDDQWTLLHPVPAPDAYTLPQAFIDENGTIRWQENYKEEQ